jgi:hypothetical protein
MRRAWEGTLTTALAMLLLLLVLASCGGGGDSGAGKAAGSSPAGTSPASTSATSAIDAQMSMANDNRAGVNAASLQASTAANVVPISVDPGPSNDVNVPFISVTLCVPGSTNCQTIDHVLVDTGSTGLRLFASALNANLALPHETSATGMPLGECMQFADGYTWGPVRVADIRLSGELARAMPVQIMGDPGFAPVPADCAATGASINSIPTFGANGVLGVGLFIQDCGPACVASGNPGLYYACNAACLPVSVPLAQQIQNPVAWFENDNNGVLIALPPVPLTGTTTVAGLLIFGIGTQTNNGLGAATVLAANPSTGYITTLYKGRTLSRSFIDSGSNGIFFHDAAIEHCTASFYCPRQTLNLSATNVGGNGKQSTVNFSVVNADEAFKASPDGVAFGGLASSNPNNNSFDWGLPFFFGRNVYTAIEGRPTPGGTGPYYAY